MTAFRFGYPGKKLRVIAVTGTNGKSTVVEWIGQLLALMGEPVGWISTASVRIGDETKLNTTKLTTADTSFLQSHLAKMVRAGAKYAVLEASSQGLAQGRLNGVPIQGAVFTNLTPEHIEWHGSMLAYQRAKELLFQRLMSSARVTDAPKVSVVNGDDPVADAFLRYPADKKVVCTLYGSVHTKADVHRRAEIVEQNEKGTRIRIEEHEVFLPFLGRFNVMNALEAVAVLEQYGFPLAKLVPALAQLVPVPGRLEFIPSKRDFQILVDYAPEPASMQALYQVLEQLHPKRILHVFGSAGGGRDKSRRPVLGKWVAEHADLAIVTNEDPYDEDPEQIIDDVVAGTKEASPLRAQVERVSDRRQAIAHALSLAKSGDLVVITGKASEQWLMGPKGTRQAWDDRQVVREELGNRL